MKIIKNKKTGEFWSKRLFRHGWGDLDDCERYTDEEAKSWSVRLPIDGEWVPDDRGKNIYIQVMDLETLEFSGHRNNDGSIMSSSLGYYELGWPQTFHVRGESGRRIKFSLREEDDRETDEQDVARRQHTMAWYTRA
jgi:hypothetical protein